MPVKVFTDEFVKTVAESSKYYLAVSNIIDRMIFVGVLIFTGLGGLALTFIPDGGRLLEATLVARIGDAGAHSSVILIGYHLLAPLINIGLFLLWAGFAVKIGFWCITEIAKEHSEKHHA